MSEDRVEAGAGAVPAPVCFRHPDRETYVSCTRCERPICPDCMRPASVGFQCPDCVREGSRSVRPARTAFGGRLDGEQGVVTRVLIGANVGVFALTVLAAVVNGVDAAMRTLLGQGLGSPLHRWLDMIPLALDPQRAEVIGVADGEYWRLVTAGFMHYGVIHLLLNMWALLILGGEVERMVGRWRFVAVYLLSGLGGTVAVYVFGATNGFVAGASASVFGLFGALFFFFRKLRMDPRGLVLIVALNFGLGLFLNVSWLGHLGGLLVGAITGALLAYAPRGPHRTLIQAIGLAVVGVALLGLVVYRTLQLI
jgi:membrane associated rhomboid family serine protease